VLEVALLCPVGVPAAVFELFYLAGAARAEDLDKLQLQDLRKCQRHHLQLEVEEGVAGSRGAKDQPAALC
jgi:hypothetical protein